MNELDDSPKETNKEKKKSKTVLKAVREIIAISVWVFGAVKLFVFDIDIFLIQRFFPNYAWVINYKFFILITLLSIIWLTTKNKQILLWSLFIIFYPIIFIFWRIPVFLFKRQSWNLVFAVIDSIILFFKSFKRVFVTTSFYLLLTVLVFQSTNKVLLWFSIIGLGIVLFGVYIQRTILIFKHSGIYQTYSKSFSSYANYIQKNPLAKLDETTLQLSLDDMDEDQAKKWVDNVQQLLLANRIFRFIAQKMNSYQNSGFGIVSSIFSILLLILYTIFTFAVINYGVFKINPQFYFLSSSPSFFNFFYFSFNILLNNQIQEIIAIAPISQSVSMLEAIYSLFLIVIFVSLLVSFKQQRITDELNSVVKTLEKESDEIEKFMKDRYRLASIEDALSALQKLKSSLIDFLYQITETIS